MDVSEEGEDHGTSPSTLQDYKVGTCIGREIGNTGLVLLPFQNGFVLKGADKIITVHLPIPTSCRFIRSYKAGFSKGLDHNSQRRPTGS